jgi:hypothetical protein
MPVPLLASNRIQTMAANSIEISVKGKWVRVPALDVNGRTIVVTGTSGSRHVHLQPKGN